VANEAKLVDQEEEVDVFSLLAPDIEEEVDDTEDDDDDSIPETLEELREALKREREIKAKRNKSLKKSKQATHRVQEENKDLLDRLDRLEQRVSNVQQPNQGTENLEKEVQEWQDRVESDPSQALAYTDWKQSKFEEKVANYLGTQFGELREMIGGLQNATNPEVIKYRDQVEALRRKEEFSQLNDDALLAIAKGLSGTKIKRPPSTIGGQRPAKKIPEATVKLTDEERAAMGF